MDLPFFFKKSRNFCTCMYRGLSDFIYRYNGIRNNHHRRAFVRGKRRLRERLGSPGIYSRVVLYLVSLNTRKLYLRASFSPCVWWHDTCKLVCVLIVSTVAFSPDTIGPRIYSATNHVHVVQNILQFPSTLFESLCLRNNILENNLVTQFLDFTRGKNIRRFKLFKIFSEGDWKRERGGFYY